MTIIAPPIAEPDIYSAPFFEALAAGRLSVQQCDQCGTVQLGRPDCDTCGAPSPAWRPASGRGVVHSFTRMHMTYHPAFADLVPYFAGLVELEEGPRLFSRLVSGDGAGIAVGQPVAVEIIDYDGHGAVPTFHTKTGSRA
jgi:uncharacterized OB-fold protein